MTVRPVRRLTAVLAGVGLLLALTAVPAQAKTTDPQKWGVKFCGALRDWADTVTDIGNSIDQFEQMTPAEGKDAIVDIVDQFDDATAMFYKTVKKAGNPDSDNGAQIEKAILQGIKGMREETAQMRTTAAALPTTDATSFKTAAQAFAQGFNTVSTPFETAMTKVSRLDESDDLGGELQKVKECKALF